MNYYGLYESKPEGWYWLGWWDAKYMEPYILKWIVTKEDGSGWVDYRGQELSTLLPPEFALGPIEMPKEMVNV